MKKRMIAMLLSICLLFSLLPLGVIAVDESYGISEDGTVEETEAPEVTEAPEATEAPAATDPEETEPEETEPEETEPEETEPKDDEPTVYEQMMAAETADDVYTILLADQQAAAVLTAEEINALIAKVEALPADDSKEELLETLNALPNVAESEPEFMATDSGNQKFVVQAAAENIQMNLFNYGPQTQISGYGFLPFVHSEGSYGWALDSSGTKPSGSAGGWPQLKTTLDSTYKFPYVVSDKGSVIKAGSLGYLFDPSYAGTGRISIDTYNANIYGEQNPYQYGSVYFPIANKDGSGTGLFQKEGNYFVYDSGKNAAWYNQDTQKFELYNYVVRPAYAVFSTSGTNGNFLPFNQGHTQGREDYQTATEKIEYTYTDDNGNTVETSRTQAKTDTVTTKPAGARTAYRLNGNSRTTEVDLWFGMNLSFDFYQPQNGKVASEDMVFEFLGDDDVWVYIDDVLILDIGGTHGAQSGTINFATGTVTNPSDYGQYGSNNQTVSSLYNLMKSAFGTNLDDSEFIDTNGDGTLDTFADFTKHNLKFYYLERGGNISYCKLKFNMDPLPAGALTVGKTTEKINEKFDNETFTFSISGSNAQNENITSFSYRKIGTNVSQEEQGKTLTTTGAFTLKSNQKVIFTSIKAGDKITVNETSTGNYTTSCNVTGDVTASGTTSSGELNFNTSNSEYDVMFTNAMTSYSLNIAKKLVNEYNAPVVDTTTYTYDVIIGGNAYTGTVLIGETSITATNGQFSMKAGQTAVIENIPKNMTYSVSESMLPEAPSGYKYLEPEYNGSTAAPSNVTLTENTTITVKNTLVPMLGNLVITKSGIESADHHINTSATEEEFQSVIFNVNGTSNSGVAIDMDVVVHIKNDGTGSVTIKDIPVGSYTVTEKENWSWRYNPDASSQKTAVVEDEKTTTSAFENNRDKTKWLNGDNYTTNIFDGSSITKKTGFAS